MGSLLDHLVRSHPAYHQRENAEETIFPILEHTLARLQAEKALASVHFLTSNLHVLPDFHGNRSPLADPDMKGSMIGLDLDESMESLALIYLATLQGNQIIKIIICV